MTSSASNQSRSATPSDASRAPRPVAGAGTQSHPAPLPVSPSEEYVPPESEPVDRDDDSENLFPSLCLPGIAGEYVRAVAETLDAPVTLTAVCALGVVAACVGSRLCAHNHITRKRTFGNLFLVAAASSGSGKSEALKGFLHPLALIQAEKIEAWRSEVATAKVAAEDIEERIKKDKKTLLSFERGTSPHNALLQQVAKLEKEKNDLLERAKAQPAVWMEDFTIEALAVEMDRNGERMFIATGEGQRVIQNLRGRNNSKGDSDDGAYCAFFSGDPYRVNRIGREAIFLQRPALSMLTLIQPDLARELRHDPGFYERGLVARILFSDTKAIMRPVDIARGRPATPEHLQSGWDSLIRGLFRCYYEDAAEPVAVKLSDEAISAIVSLHNEEATKAEAGDDAAIELRARYAEQATRLAVVLHAMRHGTRAHDRDIAGETAVAAVEIMRFFIAHQLPVIQAKRTKAESDKLTAVSNFFSGDANAREHGATARALFRAAGIRDQSAGMLFVDELVKAGVIEAIPSRRKDSKAYKLKRIPNPAGNAFD